MRVLAFTAALVATLATGTASGTPPPPPQPVDGFHTQTIECMVYNNGELICGATKRGRRVSMKSRGRAQTWVIPPSRDESDYGRLLRVGRSWRFARDFRCDRSRTKLTCKNRSAHGWVFDARSRPQRF